MKNAGIGITQKLSRFASVWVILLYFVVHVSLTSSNPLQNPRNPNNVKPSLLRNSLPEFLRLNVTATERFKRLIVRFF